jgi:methylmalonyl-CoA mutase
MTNRLFEMFPEVTAAQWKQQIQVDLKGADYNQTLISKTLEGIDVKPFYHPNDTASTDTITLPTQPWLVAQHIYAKTANSANKKAIDAISRGAESIIFSIDNQNVAITELLENINPIDVSIIANFKFLADDYLKKIPHEILKEIIVVNDVIHHLSVSGNWYTDLKTDMEAFSGIVQNSECLSIDLEHYQNAGANITQQLAYGMAQACEYLNNFDSKVENSVKQELKIVFKVAVGSNYFFEIAKIRALKLLWSTIAAEFEVNLNCKIIATPTKRNKSIYDYNNNMLRTTTECMSAILGGADIVCNLPYDAIYHKVNEFGSRIARNQLLILKHESYFDKVENIVEGNYYINDITHQLSEKALKLLKEIEQAGGLLDQLKNGTIQKKIKESANKEQTLFNEGALVLLGANKQPKKDEIVKNNLELYPFVKHNPIKTIIAPIIENRLAENLEKERLENEK